MFRIIVTSILFIIITFLPIAGTAQEKVIFYTETYPPFQSLNQQGQLVGFAIDILHASQAYVDFEIDIQIMPWSRAYKNAKKYPNTFIFSMGKTDKRLKSFKWVENFYTVQDIIYKKASRTDISIATPSDIDHYTLALARNDVSLERLKITPDSTNVYLVANQETAVKMLNFDRVDLNYNNQIGFNEAVKELGLNPNDFAPAMIANPIDLGLATNKNTRTDLFIQMKLAIEKIKQNGQFDYILAQWFPTLNVK